MHVHRTHQRKFCQDRGGSKPHVGLSLFPYEVPYSTAYNQLQTYGNAYDESLYNLPRGRARAPP